MRTAAFRGRSRGRGNGNALRKGELEGTDWGFPGGVLPPELLDRIPRARSQIEPVHPFDMRQQGVEGMVDVAFVVGVDGAVQSAQVLRSTHRAFEEPALRAVRKWRFEGGRSNGRPVSFRMAVPLHFRLAAD